MKNTNLHFKIGTFHEPPILTITRSGGLLTNTGNNSSSVVVYSGLSKDIYDYLAEAMNFTYTFEDVSRGNLKGENSVDFLLRLMVNNQIDLNTRLLGPTAERHALVDFTVPFTIEQNVIIQPMPNIVEDSFTIITKPFQMPVWILLLLAFFVTIACMALMMTTMSRLLHQKKLDRTFWKLDQHLSILLRNASNFYLYTFGTITSQGGTLHVRKSPILWIAGAWCVMAVVFVNSYNSILVAYFSTETYEPVVNTWNDMARNEKLNMLVEKNSIMANIILEAKSGPLKHIGDTLRHHPERHVTTMEQYKTLMNTGLYTFVLSKGIANERVYTAFKDRKKCFFTIGRPIDLFTFYGYAVNKNANYREAMNKWLQIMVETGILEYAKKPYRKRTDRCSIVKNSIIKQSQLSSLNLRNFTGAFTLLGFGLGMATVAFFIERLLSKAFKKSNNKSHNSHATVELL